MSGKKEQHSHQTGAQGETYYEEETYSSSSGHGFGRGLVFKHDANAAREFNTRHRKDTQPASDSQQKLCKELKGVAGLIKRYEELNKERKEIIENDDDEVKVKEVNDEIEQSVAAIMEASYAMNSARYDPATSETEKLLRAQCLAELPTQLDLFNKYTSFKERDIVLNAAVSTQTLCRSAELAEATGQTISMYSTSTGKYSARIPKVYEQSTRGEYIDAKAEALQQLFKDSDLEDCSHSTILSVLNSVSGLDNMMFQEGSRICFIMGQGARYAIEHAETEKFLTGPIMFLSTKHYSADDAEFESCVRLKCILFYCKDCEHFGIFDSVRNRRLKHHEIEYYLYMLLEIIETDAASAETADMLIQALCMYFCFLAALRCYLPANTIPAPKHAFVESVYKSLDVLENALPEYDECKQIENLKAFSQIVCAMIFMRREENLIYRWFSLYHYFDVTIAMAEVKSIDQMMEEMSILPSMFYGLSIDTSFALGDDPYAHFILNLFGECETKIFIGKFSWFQDSRLKTEVPLHKAFMTALLTTFQFKLKDFREDVEVEAMLDMIVMAFICYYLIYMWTRGVYIDGLKKMIETFKGVVIKMEPDETDPTGDHEYLYGKYNFEYPTPKQLKGFVEELEDLFFGEFQIVGSENWRLLFAFLTRIMLVRQNFYSEIRLTRTRLQAGSLEAEAEYGDLAIELGLTKDKLEKKHGEYKFTGEADEILIAANLLSAETEYQKRQFEQMEEEYKNKCDEIEADRKAKEVEYERLIQEVRDEENKIRNSMFVMQAKINEYREEIKILSLQLTEVSVKISQKTNKLEQISAEYNKWVKAKGLVDFKKQQYEKLKEKALVLKNRTEASRAEIAIRLAELKELEGMDIEARESITETETKTYEEKLKFERLRLEQAEFEAAELQVILKSTENERDQMGKMVEENMQQEIEITENITNLGHEKDKIQGEVEKECLEYDSLIGRYENVTTNLQDTQKQQRKQISDLEAQTVKARRTLAKTKKEEEKKKMEAKKALAQLVLNKSCFCAEQFHLNTMKMTRIMQVRGHYLIPCGFRDGKGYHNISLVLEPNEAKIKASMEAETNIYHSRCRMVKGVKVDSPTLSANDIKYYLESLIEKFVLCEQTKKFELNALINLICLFAYAAAQLGIKFDAKIEGPMGSHLQATIDLASQVLTDNSEHDSLSQSLDYANTHMTMPHLHCNAANCKADHETVISVTKDTANDQFIGKWQDSLSLYSNSDGFVYALDFNEELADFSYLQKVFSSIRELAMGFDPSAISGLYFAMQICFIFLDGIKSESDQRKGEMILEMKGTLMAFGGVEFGQVLVDMFQKCVEITHKKSHLRLFHLRAIQCLAKACTYPAAKVAPPKNRLRAQHNFKSVKYSSSLKTGHIVQARYMEEVCISVHNHSVTKINGSEEIKEKETDLVTMAQALIPIFQHADLYSNAELFAAAEEAIAIFVAQACAGFETCVKKIIEAIWLGVSRVKFQPIGCTDAACAILAGTVAALEVSHAKLFGSELLFQFREFVKQQLNKDSDTKKAVENMFKNDLDGDVTISAPNAHTRQMEVKHDQQKITYIFSCQDGKCGLILKDEKGNQSDLTHAEDEVAFVVLKMLLGMFDLASIKKHLQLIYVFTLLMLCVNNTQKNFRKSFMKAFIAEFTSEAYFSKSVRLQDKVGLIRLSFIAMSSIRSEKKYSLCDLVLFENLISTTLPWVNTPDKELMESVDSKQFASILVQAACHKHYHLYSFSGTKDIHKFRVGVSKGMINEEKTYYTGLSRDDKGHLREETEKRFEQVGEILEAYLSTVNMDSYLDCSRVAIAFTILMRSHSAHVPEEHKEWSLRISNCFTRNTTMHIGKQMDEETKKKRDCYARGIASILKALFDMAGDNFKSGHAHMIEVWSQKCAAVMLAPPDSETEYITYQFFTTKKSIAM